MRAVEKKPSIVRHPARHPAVMQVLQELVHPRPVLRDIANYAALLLARQFAAIVGTRLANGDAVGLARFGHTLAEVIGEALRDAPSFR